MVVRRILKRREWRRLREGDERVSEEACQGTEHVRDKMLAEMGWAEKL